VADPVPLTVEQPRPAITPDRSGTAGLGIRARSQTTDWRGGVLAPMAVGSAHDLLVSSSAWPIRVSLSVGLTGRAARSSLCPADVRFDAGRPRHFIPAFRLVASSGDKTPRSGLDSHRFSSLQSLLHNTSGDRGDTGPLRRVLPPGVFRLALMGRPFPGPRMRQLGFTPQGPRLGHRR
jgi:hypothetical protein